MRAAPRFPCRNDGDIAGTPTRRCHSHTSPDVKQYGQPKAAHREHRSSGILEDRRENKRWIRRTGTSVWYWRGYARRLENLLADIPTWWLHNRHT